MMDAATLSKAMGGTVSAARYAELVPAVNEALTRAGCTTVKRAAMFLAQIGHESRGLQWMNELADGSQYEGWAKTLGNTQPGDGKRFKGRGPLQVTGRRNYTALSKWAKANGYVPTATYFVDHPDKLAADQYGFLGAVWFWTTQAGFNTMADRGDIRGATRAINGPAMNGYDDRIARWDRCRKLGVAILPTKPAPKKPDPAKFAKGDKVILSSPKGAWTRKGPSGEPVKRNGKVIIRPKGYCFTVTDTKVVKGVQWLKASSYWYSANVFGRHKAPSTKPVIQSPVPGYSMSTPYKKRPNGWPNHFTYWRARGYHTGADWAAPQGAKIIAVTDGTIRRYRDAVLGNVALLYSSNGRTYWYCHLSAYVGADGRKAKAGQTIGKVGQTGTGAMGPHLHLEARHGHSTNWQGKDIDPLKGW